MDPRVRSSRSLAAAERRKVTTLPISEVSAGAVHETQRKLECRIHCVVASPARLARLTTRSPLMSPVPIGTMGFSS